MSIAFMAYGIRYAYGIVAPEMATSLGINEAQVGLVYSSFLGVYTATSLLVGFLVDVKDLRRVVLLFLPLFALGTGLMGLVGNLPEAALAFGIAGAGASVGWTPLVVWVQRAYPTRRGIYLGLLQIGCNLGFGTLGLLLPFIVGNLGWRAAWELLGLAAAAWLIPITAMAGGATLPERRDPSLSRYLDDMASALRERAFWQGGLSYMLASYAIMTPLAFSASYAVSMGASDAEGGALFTLIGLVGIAGALGLPSLSDRVGRPRALTINNAIMALGLAGSALAGSYWALAAWTSLIGISYGGVWVLYAALARDLYGGEVAGGVMGAWTLLAGIGLLLSPPLGGLLVDASRGYGLAYLVAAAAAALSLVFAAVAHRPSK